MAKIAATEAQIVRVPATVQEVYDFFSQPAALSEVMNDLERYEAQSEDIVRWVLKEKVDQGIRFQPDYTVRYERNGSNRVRWESTDGNMGNQGEVEIAPHPDGGCEIRYRETVEPDLPITALMAKLIRPLVSRELRHDLSTFLGQVRNRFETSASAV